MVDTKRNFLVSNEKRNCPLCNTPVNVLDGMTEAICSNCGNVFRFSSVKIKKRRIRRAKYQLIVLVLLLAVMGSVWTYVATRGSSEVAPDGIAALAFGQIDSISTQNYANTNLEYFYYIPPAVLAGKNESHPLLVLVPGQSGRGEDFVSQQFKDFADAEGFVIIAPSFMFDEDNWATEQSYQYPSVWSGDALLEIIDQVEVKNNVSVSDLYMFGFSAGAQYSARFCLWKPELCVACAAHGFGSSVIPTKYVEVKFFVTVGDQDTSRIGIVKAFGVAAIKLNIDVVYKEYSVGHELSSGQITDSLDFFKDAR